MESALCDSYCIILDLVDQPMSPQINFNPYRLNSVFSFFYYLFYFKSLIIFNFNKIYSRCEITCKNICFNGYIFK